MFYGWTLFSGIFILFIALSYAIYKAFDRGRFVPEERKDELYACGERWADEAISPADFYEMIVSALKIKRLSDIHTGNISDYLLWIFCGIIGMMIAFVVLSL